MGKPLNGRNSPVFRKGMNLYSLSTAKLPNFRLDLAGIKRDSTMIFKWSIGAFEPDSNVSSSTKDPGQSLIKNIIPNKVNLFWTSLFSKGRPQNSPFYFNVEGRKISTRILASNMGIQNIK
jgi:hypothetical protein